MAEITYIFEGENFAQKFMKDTYLSIDRGARTHTLILVHMCTRSERMRWCISVWKIVFALQAIVTGSFETFKKKK